MRTNDGKCTGRLQDKIWMIEFFKEAKAGRPSEKYDLGGIINAAFGLAGETGELVDHVKKWVFHEHEIDLEKVKKETGDILWYIAMMCESFGFQMEDVMKMNIDKLKARYPEGFEPVRSQHRSEGDI